MRIGKIGAVLAVALAFATASAGLFAQGTKAFRIGTGAAGGTYQPIGELLAKAMANPPSLPVTAVESAGSVANVAAIAGGEREAGFSQADIAYWALTGTETFDGKPKADDLRAIASLYPESIHLVVRKGLGINSIGDLKGKRVSLGEKDSGTVADARLVLAVFGVKETDLRAEHGKLDAAAEKLKQGDLDALFYVGGAPVPAIATLAESGSAIDLLPIDGPNAEKLRGNYKFLARDEIPANTYKGIEPVRTLAVGALFVTSAKVDAELVYQVTRALWSDKTRQALDAGHPKGKAIKPENALHGVGIPIHPGAERYYRETGILK